MLRIRPITNLLFPSLCLLLFFACSDSATNSDQNTDENSSLNASSTAEQSSSGLDQSSAALSSSAPLSSAISSSHPTSSSGELSSSALENVETDSTFTDTRDERIYRKTSIGSQIWMAENLNFETETSKCYNNQQSNCETYGRLYTQSDALNNQSTTDAVPSGRQGICPGGWHLPSRAEWDSLASFVATETAGAEFIASTVSASASKWSMVGKKLKAETGWDAGEEGTNNYGFSGLPGGMVYDTDVGENLGYLGRWWTASEFRGYSGYHITLSNGSDDLAFSAWDPHFFFSVRCVKN